MFNFNIVSSWLHGLLTGFMPEWGAILTESILVALAIITLYAVFAIVLIYMERKICAFFQCRLGPMRVGPWGSLQVFSDVFKMLTKEIINMRQTDLFLHNLAPFLVVTASMVTFACLPWNKGAQIIDFNVGVFFFLAIGSLGVVGILLAVLTLHGEAETDPTLPLCDLAVDDIDALSYAGNNVEVSLLKGSDGWLLADDPSLPLDQTKVQSLVEDYANLKAQRKLEGNDLAELPAKSDTPQMTITLGAGEQTVDLTVDQLNSVADVYYVYDESGAAYTVRRSDLATLSKSPRDLYKAQALTDKTTDDVAAMQVNDLTPFRRCGRLLTEPLD